MSVPETVQAAIEARIDRLTARAKHTLNAASVIGARFSAELLAALGVDAVVDELLSVELIDQVRFTPGAVVGVAHGQNLPPRRPAIVLRRRAVNR